MHSLLPPLASSASRVLRGFVEFAFPFRCIACNGSPTFDAERRLGLCADCRSRVNSLPEPACARCAMPVARPPKRRSRTVRCSACRSDPPPFRRTVAGAVYDGVVRDLVIALKFSRDRLAALPLADLAIEALRRAPDAPAARADAVVPVPLSRRRRARRGFNQADLVARRVARAFGLPVRGGYLARVRDGPPQSAAPTRLARRENVAAAFLARVPSASRPPRVLLVDDVMTTGATVEAASRALRAAGCGEVTVVVAGRAL